MTSPRAHASLVAGRYTQGSYIGGGGFGHVWEGRDERTGERVAIKWIRAGNDRELHAARVEIVTLRRLSLPGVVRLRHEGRSGEWWYLVMDHVEGRHFPGDARTWADLEPMLRQLLEVLGAVHGELIHGDLKPANILVRPDGRLVLLDFGVARGPGLPGGGMHGGTRAYMPPDPPHARDARSDLYAVGVLMLEALGAPRTPTWTMSTEAEPAPGVPRPAALAAVPPAAQRVLERLVAPDPAERPRSAFAALRELDPGRRLTPPIVGAPVPGSTTRATEEELRDLFSGPEPFLHLPSTAARLLHAATQGRGEAVEGVLERWLSDGVVVPDAGRLLPVRSRLEAAEVFPEELAFAEMVATAPADTVAREALRVAAHWRVEGRPRRAVMVLERACARLRSEPEGRRWEEPLLGAWACAALVQETTIAASAALCAVRAARWPERLEGVEALLLAMEATRSGGEDVHVPAFEDEELAAWRYAVQLYFARRDGREEEALRVIREWAVTPWRMARWQGWLAHRLYVQGRYEEASDAYLRSIPDRHRRDERLCARLNAAMAMVEAAASRERAVAICEEGVVEARAIGHAEYELAAVRRGRAGRYRMGEDLAPRAELVRAALEVDAVQGGLLAMNEAACALRAGDRAEAAALARLGQRALQGADRARSALMCRALALAAMGGSAAELHAAWTAARDAWDDHRMQVIALLCLAADHAPEAWRGEAMAIARTLPDPNQRLEVLSPAEVLSGRFWQKLVVVGSRDTTTQ